MTEKLTVGQWWADRFAKIFASWCFLLFTVISLNTWAILNSFGIITYDIHWDKSNFCLSQLTYFVDIIIIMNQMRQSLRDRAILHQMVRMEGESIRHHKQTHQDIAVLHNRLDNIAQKQPRDGKGKFI